MMPDQTTAKHLFHTLFIHSTRDNSLFNGIIRAVKEKATTIKPVSPSVSVETFFSPDDLSRHMNNHLAKIKMNPAASWEISMLVGSHVTNQHEVALRQFIGEIAPSLQAVGATVTIIGNISKTVMDLTQDTSISLEAVDWNNTTQVSDVKEWLEQRLIKTHLTLETNEQELDEMSGGENLPVSPKYQYPIEPHVKTESVRPVFDLPRPISQHISDPPITGNRKVTRKPIEAPHFEPITFDYLSVTPPDPYQYEEDTSGQYAAEAGDPWAMAAASRRGNTHRHKGTPRDDAFAIDKFGAWHILAVSDGAGSAKLSRVTANQSVKHAIEVIRRHATPIARTAEDAKARIHQAMSEAVREIHIKQTQFTQQENLDRRDTYSTLLLLVHQPHENKTSTFGVFQVGDGVMFGMGARGSQVLSAGDHGEDASSSQFVLSFSAEELVRRIEVRTTKAPMYAFALMTDGIEDDLKPSNLEFERGIKIDNKVEQFVAALRDQYLIWPFWQEWGALLFDQISYNRKGSNDDRTLAILTMREDGS